MRLGNNTTDWSPSVEYVFARCNGSVRTFYWTGPAQGAHLYSNIAYVVVNTLLSFLGVFLNGLVITVYTREKALRTSCNMLFAVLAFSDLMVSSIVQPLLIIRMVNEILGTHNCLIWTIGRLMSYFSCGVSLLTIGIISFERFITLAYPYRRQRILTPGRLKLIVATTWLVIFAFVSSHLGPVSFTILSSVGATLIILTFVMVVPMWIWIQRLVRRHQNTIESTQMPADMKHQAKKRRRKVHRTTNTCYFIIWAVLWFYLPSIVMLLYNAICDHSFVVLFLISPWAETIMFANSIFNPVFLFRRKKSFRDTAMALLLNTSRDEVPVVSRSALQIN